MVRSLADKTIEKHHSIVIEPLLDKVIDLSVQIHINEEGRSRLNGVTRFYTNKMGQWIGHYIGPFQKTLPTQITRYLNDNGQEPRRFNQLIQRLVDHVGSFLYQAGHRGHAGIDAMIHKQGNQYFFRPIVEINPRMTMGTVALALQKKIKPPEFLG